jgi:putative two-component system response regulator
VLVVDGLEINRQILRATLRSEGYLLLETPGAVEAFGALDRTKVDLVILDLVMPETSGLDFCRRMKADRKTRLIPVLILTSIQGVDTEVAGIASGADEFLIKPVHPAVVRTRVAAMLRHKAAVDSLEEAEVILFALAQAIEQRDPTTRGHCERLGALCQALGNALGLPSSQMLALHRGAFLHDIGKVGIPDAILLKEDGLSAEEWAIMRTHPLKGEQICRPMKSLAAVLPIIRSHHERWDGSGYPDGLAGEEIPLLARVLQVADIFDALTSARSYKSALSTPEAIQVLEQEMQRGWRDPELVRLLRRTVGGALAPPGDRAKFLAASATTVEQSLQNMQAALLR